MTASPALLARLLLLAGLGALAGAGEAVPVFDPAVSGPVRTGHAPDRALAWAEPAALGEARPTVAAGGTAPGGDAALAIALPACPARGRHGLRLSWRDAAGDWRGFSALRLWLRCPAGGPTDRGGEGGETLAIELRVQDAAGRTGSVRSVARPYLGGRWQPIDFALAGQWKDHQQPDLAAVAEAEATIAASARADLDLAVGSPGLLRAAGDGPRLVLRPRPGWSTAPGGAVAFEAAAERLGAGATAALAVTATDHRGRVLLDTLLAADGSGRLAVPMPEAGYAGLVAELRVDGAPVWRSRRGLAALAPPPAERDDRFGIWPSWHPALGAGAVRLFLVLPPDLAQIEDGRWTPPLPPAGVQGICCLLPPRAWGDTWFPDWDEARRTAWAALVTAAVRRIPPGTFLCYEAVNEPNARYFGPIERVVAHHRLVRDAVRAADPAALVGGPCPYNISLPYLARFFAAGGLDATDLVVVHGYHREAEFRERLRGLRALLAEHGAPGRAIVISEKGAALPGVDQWEQARTLVRSYVIALAEGVRALVWHAHFGGRDSAGRPGSEEAEPAFDIARGDGSPRPAFVAYAVMARHLAGAAYAGPLAGLPEGVEGHRFRARAGGEVLVLWRQGAGTTLVTLPAAGAASDLFGGHLAAEGAADGPRLALGPDPVYLVTAPRP